MYSNERSNNYMAEQMIFKRFEIKYMLNRAQFKELHDEMKNYMIEDVHGKSTNCSLYFDTPHFLLVRRSMEHPMYKEKLRVRSYGIADRDSTVFIELKKKYDSVTYKRRIALSRDEMEKYLIEKTVNPDTQITHEIDYCMRQYKNLAPAIFLSYDRQAFYGKDDHEFRMTFDENIKWRNYDLALDKGFYGEPILNDEQIMLEVKVANAMPMWLVRFLNDNHIYRTSFSKYAKAYEQLYMRQGCKYKTLCEEEQVKEEQIEEKQIEEKLTEEQIKEEQSKELNGGLINYA